MTRITTRKNLDHRARAAGPSRRAWLACAAAPLAAAVLGAARAGEAPEPSAAHPGAGSPVSPSSGARADPRRAESPTAPLRVHWMAASKPEHKADESLSALAGQLQKMHGLRCTFSLSDRPPDLKGLDQADVLVIYCRRLALPDDALRRLRAWCGAGRPVIAFRPSVQPFTGWPRFDREILGVDYKGHVQEKDIRVVPADGARDHPILRGVAPWTYEGERLFYRFANLADGATVLLTGAGPKASEPVAWAWTYEKSKGGRCFYTSLGLPEDFQREAFRTLLTNAIFWSAGRRVPEPLGAKPSRGEAENRKRGDLRAGQWVLGVDFSRVRDFRAGYGYAGIPDPNRAVAAPEDSGVFKIHLDSGEWKMLASCAQVAMGASLE